MLIVETIGKVRRDHIVDKKAIKAIARDRGLSRNTVRKVLRSGETSFAYARGEQPYPKLGPLSLVKTSSTNQYPILCVRVRQHHSTDDPRVRAADEVLTKDKAFRESRNRRKGNLKPLGNRKKTTHGQAVSCNSSYFKSAQTQGISKVFWVLHRELRV